MKFKEYIIESRNEAAFFISPRGEIISAEINHIVTIIKYPKKFGLTKEYIEDIYNKYNEPINLEGKAREEIIKSLMMDGWIRIRRYPNKFWSIQVLKLNNKVKDYLYDWSKRILKGLQGFKEYDKFMPVKITTLSDNYVDNKMITVDWVSKDKLYNESVTHERNMLVEKRIEELDDILIESSLSRIWQFIEYDKRSFTVISAYRGENTRKENKDNHINLKKTVRDMGYGFIEMGGGYREEEGFVDEMSLFIPSISKKEAIELGSKYNQLAILFKNNKEFVEIDTKYNKGNVNTNFIKNSRKDNITLAKEAIRDFFSKLLKGSHRGKKFIFNRIKLHERTYVGHLGRMAGRKPEWIRID